jgi:hypothetical protein
MCVENDLIEIFFLNNVKLNFARLGHEKELWHLFPLEKFRNSPTKKGDRS